MSLLTCRKIAVLKFTVFILHEEKPKGVGANFTSSEKASSVPGRMHTAVVESSGAANPAVGRGTHRAWPREKSGSRDQARADVEGAGHDRWSRRRQDHHRQSGSAHSRS